MSKNINKAGANKKGQGPLTAFVVAEPLGAKNYFKPVGLPVALAPIANRPAIDYMFENLIQNGIRKIVVIAAPQEADAIRAHVDESWSHVGGGGASSSAANGKRSAAADDKNTNKDASGGTTRNADDLENIEVRACSLNNGFFDVISHLKNSNLVRDDSYFIIVPLDAISNISNIQSLVAKAIDRHVSHKLILTAVVRQDDRSLRQMYNAVMLNEINRIGGLSVLGPADPTGGGSNGGGGGSGSGGSANEHDAYATPAVSSTFAEQMKILTDDQEDQEEIMQSEKSFAPRCTIVFDPTTGMVQAFKEWKRLDEEALEGIREERGVSSGDGGVEAPYPPLAAVPIKRNAVARVCVRTDLMVTGLLICSSDVINCSFDSYQISVADVINEFIARQIEWNLDIAIDVADSNSVVLPISSLPAFLAANNRVCARYLHPMTRDSNFGDVVGVKYSVSRSAPLICVPQEGCPYLRGSIEGAGVFGQGAALHESSCVSASSMGDATVVGKNVKIVNCVLGKNVTVCDGAVLVNSLVLDNAYVPPGCEVRDAIFGHNKAAIDAIPPYHNILKRFTLRTSHPTGRPSEDITPNNIIPSSEMLTSDNVTGAAHAADDDGEDWKAVLWDSYLNNTEVESSLDFGLKDLRTSFHKTNDELIRAMFELLVVHLGGAAKRAHEKTVAKKAAKRNGTYVPSSESDDDEDDDEDDDDEDDEVDYTKYWQTIRADLVKRLLLWEKSALWHFIMRGDVEGAFSIINGLCIGLAKTACMRPLGSKILAVLYCMLDADMFQKRDFCIVPSAAIIAFLKEQSEEDEEEEEEEDSEDSDSDDEEDENELVRNGWRCLAAYAEKVRAAEEEDDEDEDEDEDEDDE